MVLLTIIFYSLLLLLVRIRGQPQPSNLFSATSQAYQVNTATQNLTYFEQKFLKEADEVPYPVWTSLTQNIGGKYWNVLCEFIWNISKGDKSTTRNYCSSKIILRYMEVELYFIQARPNVAPGILQCACIDNKYYSELFYIIQSSEIAYYKLEPQNYGSQRTLKISSFITLPQNYRDMLHPIMTNISDTVENLDTIETKFVNHYYFTKDPKPRWAKILDISISMDYWIELCIILWEEQIHAVNHIECNYHIYKTLHKVKFRDFKIETEILECNCYNYNRGLHAVDTKNESFGVAVFSDTEYFKLEKISPRGRIFKLSGFITLHPVILLDFQTSFSNN